MNRMKERLGVHAIGLVVLMLAGSAHAVVTDFATGLNITEETTMNGATNRYNGMPSAIRANLTLDRHSPPAQVEMTFLAADGSVLSHSSKPVKKSFRGEQSVPPGAVSVKFAVFRLPGCGEPRVKSFAPAASRPSP